MMAARGLDPVLESERAVGGFWQSTGLAAAAAVVAAVISRRSRPAGAALAAAAALAMADDVDNGMHLLRRLLPKRTTTNVMAWAGDGEAPRTIVLVAHHDAAHSGLMFHPSIVPFLSGLAPGLYARQKTSTQTGRLLVFGPAAVAAGAVSGSRRLRRLGLMWSAATALLLADVARSPVVPGANDNLSAVAALLEVAERLAADPVDGVRVLLLSTGSEESFMEGMRGFIARHRAELDPARTAVVAIECIGSPHLAILEGEGMLRIRDYDAGLREELARCAQEAGVEVWRGLRLGAGGTDALPAMRSGLPAACLAACNELKVPSNYHWASDTTANLDWSTVGEACDVLTRLIRRGGARSGLSAVASV